MNICVIGAGYVGLVTVVGLAKANHQVICVDKDKEKIQQLRAGKIPIYEKDLEKYLKQVCKKKLLSFSQDLENAVQKSEIIFIAVWTPEQRGGAADLRSVRAVAEQISKFANEKKIVVIKSTVPVGTAENIEEVIKQVLKKRNKKFKISVVSNPEFLQQGKALKGVLKPDRIVIGAKNKSALLKVKKLYKSIRTKFILTDNASTELIKYASNAFLATKISFINEVADLCEKTGGDVAEVARGMGLDRRINPYFLNAGIGYGGSCFPKDTKALHHIARGVGNRFKLLEAVIEVNRMQKFRFLEKLKSVIGGFKNKRIAVLGLAFKGETDDVRESVAIEICKYLLDEGAKIKAYDPQAMKNAEKLLPRLEYCKDAYTASRDAKAILVLAEWKDFINLNFVKLKRVSKKPNLFDGKNYLNSQKIRKAGFKYFGVGRK